MDTVTETKPSAVLNELPVEEQKDSIVAVDFKMVTFALAGKDYAIDIMKVKEIAKAGNFTYVPNTVPFVLGVYNLRGEIIPIVDLRRFFNIEVPEYSKSTLESMLIVTVEDQLFGVVVDAIDKVIGIQKSTIQPPHPLFGDINIKYISGVAESNDRLYVLLDVDRIFGVRGPVRMEEQTQSSATASEPQVAVPETKEVSATRVAAEPAKENVTNIDYTFIRDSLQKLKSFYVSPVNETWIKRRFEEWAASKGGSNVQLLTTQDADSFLSSFYSSQTGVFWSKEYAEAVFKSLPDNSAKQITVWNPGCGKGYESYSLACVLKKRYPNARIKIYAQDVDLLNISNAPLLQIPAEVAGGWYKSFVVQSVSGGYTFASEIKDMILFEYHDCIHANTMPVVDIIFARDLLSFLAPSVQATLLGDFDEKLKGNGIVFVGENETLAHIRDWSEKMINSIVVYTKG